MFIHSLNIGRPQIIADGMGNNMNSAIGKKSVSSVLLSENGFEGDKVADKKHHGGKDRAVCFYPFEHYREWEQFCERALPIPAFGENLTVTNMLETEVCIGDIYQMGDVTVQITQGRIPCATIDRFNRKRGMLAEVIRSAKTGFFAKVLEGGVVQSHSSIQLVDRPQPHVTIAQIHQLFFHQRHDEQAIAKMIEIPELAEVMREQLKKVIKKSS
ncbi:MOSC domain-containing protein [Bacillus sp. FJAT-50079]|uniref:MOSC domain-containing protein n=1 Tax=Bacillus sp. FJAT-50079 TaxID=2833577 RepID=UPI001BC969F8|nr:MOSC domain-containing protein [Bacillus sp. FJAT-50079]MBS4209881.1 MOSC domain-containing protein [Bacillus sp. FJAT-50079]